MPRHRAARRLSLSAVLLVAALSPRAAAAFVEVGGASVHLEREEGAGYTRPRLRSQACLVEALEARPVTAGLDAQVRFSVLRDAQLEDFAFQPPPAPAVARAVEEALRSCPWSAGLDPEGRPVVVRVTQPLRVRLAGDQAPAGPAGRADRDAGPGVSPPPVATGRASLRLEGADAAGYRRPDLEDPPCLTRALQGRKSPAGLDNKVKFAVMRDGSVRSFSFFTPVPAELERDVVAAFQSCAWRPALDPGGVPLAVWVVQPLKVAPLPPPPERQRPLF